MIHWISVDDDDITRMVAALNKHQIAFTTGACIALILTGLTLFEIFALLFG